MAYDDQKNYDAGGNKVSDQAEPSSANRAAGQLQMRILIELQVLSYLIAQAYELTDDLQKLRQDLADEIT